MISMTINDRAVTVDVDPGTPLLWVLRDELGLKGTKYACGAGLCGSCTVHVNGEVVRSCLVSVERLVDADVRTIEGLQGAEEKLHPVQQAWREMAVPQCGYCQSGFIMATVSLLSKNPDPTDADIDNSITNLCRCGTYGRVRKAIKRAAELAREQ